MSNFRAYKWCSSYLLVSVCATFVACAQTSEKIPLSNEAFAAQVYKIADELREDPQMAESARIFCQALSRSRAEEEPRCVALQNFRDSYAYLRNRKAQSIASKRSGKSKPVTAKRSAEKLIADKVSEPAILSSDSVKPNSVDFFVANPVELKSKLAECMQTEKDAIVCANAKNALAKLVTDGELLKAQ